VLYNIPVPVGAKGTVKFLAQGAPASPAGLAPQIVIQQQQGPVFVDDHCCCGVMTLWCTFPLGVLCALASLCAGCDAKNAAMAGDAAKAKKMSKEACNCIVFAWVRTILDIVLLYIFAYALLMSILNGDFETTHSSSTSSGCGSGYNG